jgi:hypothetical protein
MSSSYYRGKPRTSGEWAALARIAGGRTDISREELRCLFMLGLVDRQWGRVCLSEHGRTTLGLPHGAFGAPGLAFLRQEAPQAP